MKAIPRKIFASFLFFAFGCFLTSSAVSQNASSPEATVKQFYVWYIDALEKRKGQRPPEAELKRFITANYLKQVKGVEDADLFLHAQDWDPDWGKNLRVLQSKVVEDGAKVEILMTGKVIPNHQLNLALIKEAGGWKIDHIQAVTK